MSSARPKKPLSLEEIQALSEYKSLLDSNIKADIEKLYTTLNKVNRSKLAAEHIKPTGHGPAQATNITRALYKNQVHGYENLAEVIKNGILDYIDDFFDKRERTSAQTPNKPTASPAATTAAAAATPPVAAAATTQTPPKPSGQITDHTSTMANFVTLKNNHERLLRDIAIFAGEYVALVKECKESKSDPLKLQLTKALLKDLEAQYAVINKKTSTPEEKTKAAIEFYKLLNKAADQKSFKTGLFSSSYKTINPKELSDARENKTLSIRNVIAKYMTQGDYLKLRELVNEAKKIQSVIEESNKPQTPKP